MAKYRKKPVVIEAIQFDGINHNEIREFMGLELSIQTMSGELSVKSTFDIKTLEGVMQAQKGDYIIKGVQGEFYPCKPDIFIETYEKVSDE